MSRRSPEQVHDKDGHPEFVASCRRCQTEAEHDRNVEAARAELANGGHVSAGTIELIGEPGCEFIVPENINLPSVSIHGDGREVLGTVEEFTGEGPDRPLPDADPAGSPDDAVDLPAELAPARRALTADGRPKCYVDDCPLPEFADDIGLCGGHWSNRPDLRKVAHRG